MMSRSQRYVVVVGIDFSERSDRALDQALAVASLNQGEVHAIYVESERPLDGLLVGPFSAAALTAVSLQKVEQHASGRVAAITAARGQLYVSRVVAHLRYGSAAAEIAELAAQLDADLVVVGSHGRRGVERILLGSVAERVSRLSRCPVWIVRPKHHQPGERVPEIEPPCAACVARREATNDAEFWCMRHSEHHPRAHVFSYSSDRLNAAGSSP